MAFYLNTNAIMDMYQQLRYRPALQRAVREEIRRSSNAVVRAAFPGTSAGADVDLHVDRKVFHEYIEKDEPITVISIIMDVLEKTGDIAQVDLEQQTVTPNRAMTGNPHPSRTTLKAPRGSMRIRDLDSRVLVKGVYRQGASGSDGTAAFHAPYGEPDDPDGVAHVRIDCDTGGLRRRVPDGPFLARCLGRVERWESHTRELVIDPIAVFK